MYLRQKIYRREHYFPPRSLCQCGYRFDYDVPRLKRAHAKIEGDLHQSWISETESNYYRSVPDIDISVMINHYYGSGT